MKMFSFTNIRNEQYEYNISLNPYINNWRKNPYTFLKARFYMECSAILVYFLLKTKISPNAVTILYVLCGILGGILLSIPNTLTIYCAVAIFFSKGILDWSDGHLARATNQTSVTGHILDVYGATVNDLGLLIGFGFYVANQMGNPLFFYLVPLIPFFFAANLIQISKTILFDLQKDAKQSIIKHNIQNSHLQNQHNSSLKQKILRFSYSLLQNFFDSRARSVDLICLLIVIELNIKYHFTWVVFLLIILKHLILFFADWYIVLKRQWAEKYVN